MDNNELQMEKVMRVLMRDNPKEVERAALIVRNQELEEENKALVEALAATQGDTDDSSD